MSDLSRARHWRQRAEELRAIAENLRTKVARESLLNLADRFDRMAERLERGEPLED